MVSIYDKNISFETVEEKAKEVSRKVKEPVLYLSGCGGDVFVIGVVAKGKCCTRGVVGENPQDYGLDECCVDLKKIEKWFGLSVESLEKLFVNTDTEDAFDLIEDIQSEFEKLLRVPLNFRREWISTYDGVYQKKYGSNGVEIYERL